MSQSQNGKRAEKIVNILIREGVIPNDDLINISIAIAIIKELDLMDKEEELLQQNCDYSGEKKYVPWPQQEPGVDY